LHPQNIHIENYNFDSLSQKHSELSEHVFINDYGNKSIDFSNSESVLQLNMALLRLHYGIEGYELPKGYLCPAIPGRVDYIHYIADLLSEENKTENIKGLDIGTGANCIYPILATQTYDWRMVGCDIDKFAVDAAKNNVSLTKALKDKIEIRHQSNNANIFEGIINVNEKFDFTMCNPPFHTSEKEALSATKQKMKNLKSEVYDPNLKSNFSGQANELWCNGGESLFIKRMIKQSVAFKDQVGWFTSLVSKKENLSKLKKQLDKLKAEHRIVEMEIGNKKTRFIAWKF